jgi:hypothetical protein
MDRQVLPIYIYLKEVYTNIMIYLSNFRTAGKDKRAISIAAITPKWYKGEVRKDLAPPFSLVKDFKDGKKTVTEYLFEYVGKLYTNIDFANEAERLDGKILLCYCDKDVFCHRAIFGLYLQAETGVEVEEKGGYGDWFTDIQNHIKKGDGYPVNIDFLDTDIERYDLKDIGSKSMIGAWNELKKRNLLHLYKEIEW